MAVSVGASRRGRDASAQALADYREHVNRGRAKLASLLGGQLEVASDGNIVFDELGQGYLDCGGSGVFLLGHRHPRVVAAVQEQLQNHPLATRMLLEPVQGEAARALARVAPAGLDYVHFTTSGAEATEVALKIARLNGKRQVVATEGGFHGKSLGALSATGSRGYREPFEPLLDGVVHVPFGDLDALDRALARCDGQACVIVEPVQSVGGVVIAPEGYLAGVREACTRNDALMIADEIQTGLGRVGEWWACESEQVVPDMLLAGKVLGGGVLPIGAVVSSAVVYEPLSRDPLLHNATFTGAPIVMAAARAAIEVLEDEQVVARAKELGDVLLPRLREALGDQVIEVRGRGLLIGIELASAPLAGDLTLELLSRRVLVNASVYSRPVVSLTPPAGLSAEEVAWLLDATTDAALALRERYHKEG
jgi:putrescine aminotransferase